ncbi:hypothetical protein [Alkalicoccus chagannorensis]|uniref:hypothetical protein n=1 Tax=Alkalicoccus chagannorensis TaxID=427072 RepID=UPI00040027D1|nr:hypothetical protein [Alkalicoccus chagannorensis]
MFHFKLRWKAKKYRIFVERIRIMPYPVTFEQQSYYLVHYQRWKNVTGRAVFSKEPEHEADARRAFDILYHFYSLMDKIQEDGRMRAGIQLDLFKKPMKKMEEHWHEDLADGHEFLETVLALQLKYRENYDEFQQLLEEMSRGSQSITADIVRRTEKTAAMQDVIQDEIMKKLGAESDRIRSWMKAMKTHGLWEKLTKSEQVFYQQLLHNEALMKEERKKMDVVRHGNYDKMIQLNLDRITEYKKQEKKEAAASLRYPG